MFSFWYFCFMFSVRQQMKKRYLMFKTNTPFSPLDGYMWVFGYHLFFFCFWRVISPFLLSPSISSCGLILNHGYFSDTPITDLLHVISWSSYSLLISGIAIFCIFICVLCQSLQCIVLLPPLKSSVVSIVLIWWNPYIILHCSNF